ncbi:ABC transporter permease [Sphingosinicella rhizophila]|uniref:ABC transporter permease n=1 Tax=Sphingosinicella rhizophila TaxID=3050082 RepID=A0ABU3Q713_9SPHN|nr:ABC transporter permease [Sphingosinicella sp. GR2756]MDT9599184.1 ABC transporter permease [Sphingosinicella sp. GR2756]
MKRILLIAAREYRQITRMRSFWLTLLILPLAFAIAPLAQRFMNDDDPRRIMIIDQSGGNAAEALQDRLALDHSRDVLISLSRYVQRHKLQGADPKAPWSQHDRWYTDAEVRQFTAGGGLARALAKLQAHAPEDTPEFDPPGSGYELVPVPKPLAAAPPSELDARVRPLLKPEGKGAKPVDYILQVPASFGRDGAVRLWSTGEPNIGFVTTVQDVLTRNLRKTFLLTEGTAPDVAEAASTIAPSLMISKPPPGGGAKEAMLVRSILPLASSYLLMVALMLSGSWMLQGTVEERSNKLLETVLATVSPEELMYGKLLGTVAVGLTMIAVWVGCGAVAAYATQGAIADLIRPALAPLTSPGTIAAMIYFFIAGYLAISIFFLAVGAISDSMNEAQGYLMPILLAILLPITVLIQSILQGGKGIGITVLTWVPIWTPFAILARLGTGIPTWEVLCTGLLLAAFIAVELIMLGRLFRASLLAQGQKPGFSELISRMRRQDA